jgi:hypothetical protein
LLCFKRSPAVNSELFWQHFDSTTVRESMSHWVSTWLP